MPRSPVPALALAVAAAAASAAAAQESNGAGSSSSASLDGELEDAAGLAWWRIAELAIVGAVLLVLLCGMVWHLSTFSAWINATLQMAQERGVEGLVSRRSARAPAGSQRCLSARRGRWTI